MQPNTCLVHFGQPAEQATADNLGWSEALRANPRVPRGFAQKVKV
jgi:hypothetical protein